MSRVLQPLYGGDWRLTGEGDLMADELGHRRHSFRVPCFLGGKRHSYRTLGEDIRHCVLKTIRVCVYCGREQG